MWQKKRNVKFNLYTKKQLFSCSEQFARSDLSVLKDEEHIPELL